MNLSVHDVKEDCKHSDKEFYNNELEENNEYDSEKRRIQQVVNEVRIGTI